MTVLAVRGLFENLAYLCYARDGLRRVYQGELPRSDMTWLSVRLRFAQRDPVGLTEREEERTKAVNVLTVLKHLDKHATDKFGDTTRADLYSRWYIQLCEFAHPNALGIEAGSRQDFARNTFTFEMEPRIREDVMGCVASPVFSAQYTFFELYNECWSLMIDHGERLPTMTPPGDPRVLIK